MYVILIVAGIVTLWLAVLANLLAGEWHNRRRQRAEERHYNGWDRKGDVA